MSAKGLLKRNVLLLLAGAAVLAGVMVFSAAGRAQEEGGKKGGGEAGKGGPPPAPVVVAPVRRGEARPMAEYVGTVFYAHVSDVAAEVEGKVESASYEEGQRVKAGEVLVRLGADILDSTIEGTRASFEQAVAEREKAEKDLRRVEPLYKEGAVSESLYDDNVYAARSAGKKAEALKAELQRLELEKERKTIRAPFSGIVVKKAVEEGEWVSEGGTVAVVADNREVDVVVDVPEELLGYLSPGMEIEIRSRGKKLTGRFMSYVPRGDVATRTFSIKLRLRNTAGLVEGMEARAMLPAGASSEGILVPRDAVVNRFGQDVVFTVNGSQAKMVPVRVTGYEGMTAGVEAEGLEEGMDVVVEGNERIMDGQSVFRKNNGMNNNEGKNKD